MIAPPSAAFLIIGNEILTGKVREENLLPLAKLLNEKGIRLGHVEVVGDDKAVLGRALLRLSESHTWLFTSGGMGPTHDDVTLCALSQAFGTPLFRSPELTRMLERHYGERLTAAHLRMAEVPQGAELVYAPDIPWPALCYRNVWILPGVPEIFRRKLEVVRPRLRDSAPLLSLSLYSSEEEGDLVEALDAVVSTYPDLTIGSYPTISDQAFRTRITFDGYDKGRLFEARAALCARLGETKVIRLDP